MNLLKDESQVMTMNVDEGELTLTDKRVMSSNLIEERVIPLKNLDSFEYANFSKYWYLISGIIALLLAFISGMSGYNYTLVLAIVGGLLILAFFLTRKSGIQIHSLSGNKIVCSTRDKEQASQFLQRIQETISLT